MSNFNHLWGSGPVDLSQNKLTGDEKNFLADLVINKKMKSKDVSNHFNISRANIRAYTYRRKVSNTNYANGGRFKKIDYISDLQIKDILRNEILTYGKQIILDERLRKLIRSQAFESYRRKNTHLFVTLNRLNKPRGVISYDTVMRYYNIYKNFINELNVSNNNTINNSNDNSFAFEDNWSQQSDEEIIEGGAGCILS